MKTLLSILAIAVFFHYEMESKLPASTRAMKRADSSEGLHRASTFANFGYHGNSHQDDSLQAKMLLAIDEVRIQATEAAVYSLTSDFIGYESSNYISYYFDSLYSLTYCTIDWSSEGTSGSSSYYFKNDKLVAGSETNDYMDSHEEIFFHIEFKPVSGYKITTIPDAEEGDVSSLSFGEIDKRQTDVINEFQGILGAIRENASALVISDFSATLHREETANYGEDFTSTQDFTMDLAIFEHFIKE